MSGPLLLNGTPYERLLRRVRDELQRRGFNAKTLRLTGLADDECQALADLQGLSRLPTGATQVRVSDLDAALRRSAVGAGLPETLTALYGPLTDARAARATHREDQSAAWALAASDPTVTSRPELAAWLAGLRARGAVSRAARATGIPTTTLLQQALAVVGQLPATDTALAVLAATTLGDAHALDPGRPLTPWVLAAAAALTKRPTVPIGGMARRRLWAAVGVICDPLSCHALVHNLRPIGTDRLARRLRDAADAGEPTRVTLRELTRSTPTWTADTIYLCENPSITALAADALGVRCRPLICTEGQPSAAVMHVLAALRNAGATLLYHGDFDWPGLRIANHIMRALDASPWHFRSNDYRRLAESQTVVYAPLRGSPVTASWDAGLETAMRNVGVAIYEEQAAQLLLDDLDSGGR